MCSNFSGILLSHLEIKILIEVFNFSIPHIVYLFFKRYPFFLAVFYFISYLRNEIKILIKKFSFRFFVFFVGAFLR